jgi:UDP-N-acetylmuramoyl-L-alanyl-D-glutamate--2,6-diaminopimelate ligase
MLLSELLLRVPDAVVAGPVDRPVGRVLDRDEDVRPDDVFVAIRGARVDGHDRVPALSRAAAVVVEHGVAAPPTVTVVRVPDTRRALPLLCARRLGDPGARLKVVAVTGTNGKTSTTFLLAAIARAAGLKPGIIGTTGHLIGDTRVETEHTTPTAPVVQDLLARMVEAGVGLVAMEASSIGLATHRCDGIPFAAAVFTNLTRDHLDFHGDMERYAEAKARLFRELLAGTAVLNAADPASPRMVPGDRPVWWFNERDVWAEDPRFTLAGTSARVHTPRGDGDLHLQLLGSHNLENALGALGAALAVGIPLDRALAGLAALPAVPGRLERVPNDRDLHVFVDYAHTDDALHHVLGSLRQLGARRIITVFGCGGDRDRGKRPLMGRAAAERSDLVVLTADNPRSERVEDILADTLPGIGATPHHVVPDRRAAIHLALSLAHPGDVVLIAGKGHEPYQEILGVKHPFDDRLVAAEWLA